MSAFQLIFGLLLASSGAPPEGTGVLTILRPSEGLPKLAHFLEWAALAEPALLPAQLGLRSPLSPLPLFDPLVLERELSLDLQKGIRIWFDPHTLAFELSIRDPGLAKRYLDLRLEGRAEVEPLPGTEGSLLASPGRSTWIRLEGPTLWLLIWPTTVDPKTALLQARAFSAVLKKRKKQAPARALSPAAPFDLAIDAESDSEVERLRAELSFLETGFTLRFSARMSTSAEVVAGELFDAKTHVRPLFSRPEPALEPAAEILVHLKAPGVRRIAERQGLLLPRHGLFTGEAHLLLGSKGDLLLGLPLVKKARAAEIDLVTTAIMAKRRGLSTQVVENGKERVLVAVLAGGGSALSIGPSVLLSPLAEAQGAPIAAHLNPARLERALEGRADAPDGIGPSTMQLLGLRIAFRPILMATGPMILTLLPKPPLFEGKLEVAYAQKTAEGLMESPRSGSDHATPAPR